MRSPTLRLKSALFALLVFAGFFVFQPAYAQAPRETAIQAVRLRLYGTGDYTRPQYIDKTGSGFMAGGGIGFTVHHVHRLEPSFDIRYTYSSSTFANEKVFGGGLRLLYHVARFHPYGDFLAGTGNLDLKKPVDPHYTHDNSIVYTYGGGLTYDLTRNWGVMADIQRQRWHLAESSPPFYPLHIGFGLRYTFHFRNYNGPE